MRKIAVFTGTRAEYGLLRVVLKALENLECICRIYASGTHLSDAHSHTLHEIQNDGFKPICVDMEVRDGDFHATCSSMGILLDRFSAELQKDRPDLLVVLGDRFEAFAAATVATLAAVPIAHLHGGEQTAGLVDEAFRHSITKMSHLHFTSCEEYRQRVIQLGEDPQRVWNVGALGVENALLLPLLDEAAVREFLRLEPDRPYFLCTFHPVTLEPGQENTQWHEVQQALEAYADHAVVVTGANADPGGGLINRMLAEWSRKQPGRVRLFDSLGVLRYLSTAKYAACVVGNSSSGIIEIPSLGVPVVDIGNRQKGRVRSAAVLHCDASRSAIGDCVAAALSLHHRTLALAAANPYRGENTSGRIAQLLCEYPLGGILMKQFYDLRGGK